MSHGGYRPGDNKCVCDLSGFECYQSETVKTWDGLRVLPEYWYPRHPQLDVRAVPERPGVIDGRPEPPDTFFDFDYKFGSFCLISPNGTYYTFWVDDDGALKWANVQYGNALTYFDVGGWRFNVDDDGALHMNCLLSPDQASVVGWLMYSPNNLVYEMRVAADKAVTMTLVATYG